MPAATPQASSQSEEMAALQAVVINQLEQLAKAQTEIAKLRSEYDDLHEAWSTICDRASDVLLELTGSRRPSQNDVPDELTALWELASELDWQESGPDDDG